MHQILTQLPHNICAEILRMKLATQDWTMGGYTRPTAVPWSWNELQDVFRSAMSQAQRGQYIYIYADGLDEYYHVDSLGQVVQPEDNDDAADVRVEGQSEIAELFLGLSKNPYVKICVSSRSQQPFEGLFRNITVANLRLKMEVLTRPDIERLVKKRLSSHPRMERLQASEPGFKDELIRDVVAKADGVFAWVDLITRRLRSMLGDGDRVSELRAYLEYVPSQLGGPNGLYMSLLKGIKKRHRVDAARLLRAVLNARHPLTAVCLSYCEFDSNEAIQTLIRRRTNEELRADAIDMEDRIRSRCAGILELAPDLTRSRWSTSHSNCEPVVRFIHLTAREFLQRQSVWDVLLNAADSEPLVDPNISLLGSCLLRLKCIGVTGNMEDVWSAVHDAIYYAGRAELITGVAQSSLLDDLDATMLQLVKEQWPEYEDENKEETNITFVWSSREDFLSQGYHWVSLEPQEQGGKIYSTNDDFLTYAMWGNLERYLAAKIDRLTERVIRERLKSDLRFLLQLAIAPNDPPSLLNYGWDRLGVDQCSSTVVRLLLENGCDPEQRVGPKTVWEMMMCWKWRLTPLHVRASNSTCWHDANYMDIMRAMIEHGANPNVVGAHMCSLLFMAATCADIPRDRRQSLANLLLQRGAELFPQEAEKLRKVISWADVNTWPVLEEKVQEVLVARRADSKRYRLDVRNTVPAKRVEEIRALLEEEEEFFTPMSSPLANTQDGSDYEDISVVPKN